MKVSQKSLYALKALMLLARRHPEDVINIREIAEGEELPELFYSNSTMRAPLRVSAAPKVDIG